MTKLPDKLSIQFANNKFLSLTKEEFETKSSYLSGLSEKSCYQDAEKNTYFVKLPKPRKTEDILPKSVAPVLYEAQQAYETENDSLKKAELKIQYEKLQKQYQQHQNEVRDAFSFLEVLSPKIAKGIFGDFIEIPENYFTLGDDGAPLILSKAIPGFKEFLSENSVVQGKTKPSDWDEKSLPTRDQLKLSKEQAEALGKLLGVALLMGHLDLLNNINLSNSGVVETSSGKLIPAIVDWGNTMGIGFGGLSADESSFKNPDINEDKTSKNNSITGFQHCVPFDEIVYPLLPRQLVKDLFNMSDKDEISQAMLSGFRQSCVTALCSLDDIDDIVSNSISNTFKQNINKYDVDHIKKIQNNEIFTTSKQTENKYNLANVLKRRILSLFYILEELENGKTLTEIATNRLKKIKDSQYHPEKNTTLQTQSIFSTSQQSSTTVGSSFTGPLPSSPSKKV